MKLFTENIIPLICLFTIHKPALVTFQEMYEFVCQDSYLHELFIQQTQTWWGESVTQSTLNSFMSIFTKYTQETKEVTLVVQTIKELFSNNRNHRRNLSKLVDKYFIPLESEKKDNAEVSSPYSLRQSMIDLLPDTFFHSLKTVLEPCVGKCGFILDVMDRFMVGLQDLIQDPEKRYQTILETCLYFGDINPVNVFIAKLLLDPFNQYKLNVFQRLLETRFTITISKIIL